MIIHWFYRNSHKSFIYKVCFVQEYIKTNLKGKLTFKVPSFLFYMSKYLIYLFINTMSLSFSSFLFNDFYLFPNGPISFHSSLLKTIHDFISPSKNIIKFFFSTNNYLLGSLTTCHLQQTAFTGFRPFLSPFSC